MSDLLESMTVNEEPNDTFVQGIPTDTFDDAPLRCQVCGVALIYGGRGRKPKFCSEHKKGSSNSSGSPISRGGTLKALENSLTEMYMALGTGVTLVSAPDGFVIVNHAEKMAHSWIVLAENNPKVRKFLMKLTTGSGTGAVLIAHGAVALAIMANHDITLNTFLGKKDN